MPNLTTPNSTPDKRNNNRAGGSGCMPGADNNGKVGKDKAKAWDMESLAKLIADNNTSMKKKLWKRLQKM